VASRCQTQATLTAFPPCSQRAWLLQYVSNKLVAGRTSADDHCVTGGDLFVDYEEQRALLDILVKTDLELGWPTRTAQSYLRHAWGWD
jgi:hypothetical protein